MFDMPWPFRVIYAIVAAIFVVGTCVAFALLPWYWAALIGVVAIPIGFLGAMAALFG